MPDVGLPDRFNLRAAGFLVRDTTTEFRLDSDLGIGTGVDADALLGLPQAGDVFRADGYFRLAPNCRIDFSRYRIALAGSKRIDDEITFRDETFPINFQLDSRFQVDTYKLGYSYSFYRNEKVELGLGIGAHVQESSSSSGGALREDARVTAPLPVFRFRLDYAITRRLIAKAALQLFLIEIDKYEGALSDFEVDLEYRVLRDLAFGVGVNSCHHRYARREGKQIRGISRETLDLLQSYRWPGNVRELQNVIERAVILSDTETLSVDEAWLAGRPREQGLVQRPLGDELVTHEKARIEAALKESRGRVSGPSGAAARLGIPRSTLESKIRSLGIDKHRFRAS